MRGAPGRGARFYSGGLGAARARGKEGGGRGRARVAPPSPPSSPLAVDKSKRGATERIQSAMPLVDISMVESLRSAVTLSFVLRLDNVSRCHLQYVNTESFDEDSQLHTPKTLRSPPR